MDDSPSVLVVKRLRAFRKIQDYTLHTLSEPSSVSANTISPIERGITSPMIATKHKLATALAISLIVFYAEAPINQVIFTKRDQWHQKRCSSVFIGNLGEAKKERLHGY